MALYSSRQWQYTETPTRFLLPDICARWKILEDDERTQLWVLIDLLGGLANLGSEASQVLREVDVVKDDFNHMSLANAYTSLPALEARGNLAAAEALQEHIVREQLSAFLGTRDFADDVIKFADIHQRVTERSCEIFRDLYVHPLSLRSLSPVAHCLVRMMPSSYRFDLLSRPLMENTTFLATEKDYLGRNALHLAVSVQDPEKILAMLYKLGCSVNDKDLFGRTALHVAAESGAEQTVAWLLQRHAISSKDASGSTPLQYAAERGRSDILKLLLAHETVEELVANEEGRTLSMLARGKGYEELAQYLEAAEKQAESERNRWPELSVYWSPFDSFETIPTSGKRPVTDVLNPFISLRKVHLDTERLPKLYAERL